MALTAQNIDTACAEPFDPFGHRLRRGVELARGGGIAQSRFHTPHHGLSTFLRQGSILVAVHLVSPWNTEASQPQLPRFGPDEQPPERPQLERFPAKWRPVRVKKTRQIENLEPRSD